MLGAALFGAGGALLAIPVTAMMLAVFESYAERRHVVTELVPGELAPTLGAGDDPDPEDEAWAD